MAPKCRIARSRTPPSGPKPHPGRPGPKFGRAHRSCRPTCCPSEPDRRQGRLLVGPTRPGFGLHIRNEVCLPGSRLHDLHQTWGSVVAAHGINMVTIAKLVDHAFVETTERYVHLSDARCPRPRSGCRAGYRPSWPEAETPAMPTARLTLRLARDSRPAQRDLFVGRTRRIVIAATARWPRRPAAPARCWSASARATTLPTTSAGLAPPPPSATSPRSTCAAAIPADEPRSRAHLPLGAHTSDLQPHAPGPDRPLGRGGLVRCRQPGVHQHGQPGPQDPARDDVPRREVGLTPARRSASQGGCASCR